MVIKSNKIRTLVFTTVFMLFAPILRADYIIIANPSVDTQQLSFQKLGQIYALQVKTWQGGQHIKAFTYPVESSDHKEFVLFTLKIQPHQLKRLWNRLIFTGTGSPPKKVMNSEEMLEKVKRIPGAIGYVRLSDNIALNGVKVVEVSQR